MDIPVRLETPMLADGQECPSYELLSDFRCMPTAAEETRAMNQCYSVALATVYTLGIANPWASVAAATTPPDSSLITHHSPLTIHHSPGAAMKPTVEKIPFGKTAEGAEV